MLTELECSFLCACQEDIARKHELVPLLAHHMGVPPEELYYQWRKPRTMKRGIFYGFIGETNWEYRFHGNECEIENSLDGRHLRIEFGPHGRFDTVSDYTIFIFVRAAKAPWREFPELREFFAEEHVNFANKKALEMAERLYQLGYFEVSGKELCALVEEHTIALPDGSSIELLPSEFQDPMKHAYWDVQLRNRWVLSELGKQTIQSDIQVS